MVPGIRSLVREPPLPSPDALIKGHNRLPRMGIQRATWAPCSSSIISRLQEGIPNFQDTKQATAALLVLSKLQCLQFLALQFPLIMHYGDA